MWKITYVLGLSGLCLKKSKNLLKEFQPEVDLKNHEGVSLDELPKIEQKFKLNIFVFTEKGQTVRRSPNINDKRLNLVFSMKNIFA